ncbi:hypothetical protein [Okeania sp. SIO3B5]|nr:hypothetical protein [Okeania sp. SIO3B5]
MKLYAVVAVEITQYSGEVILRLNAVITHQNISSIKTDSGS